MPRLETTLCGQKLKNPTALASGILDTAGATMKRVAASGCGLIITKSYSKEPREGYKAPIVVETPSGMLNAVGLPNPGMIQAVKELEIVKAAGVPIVASIFGGSVDEFVEIAAHTLPAKPVGIELNLSCPHVKGHGVQFGENPEIAAEVTKAVVKAAGKIPVIPKLSPNVLNIGAIARAVENAGAKAITAVNTVGSGMVIDTETATPVLTNKRGGLSGPAMRPIAVRCIYDIYEAVKIPIIGMGGVQTGEDAIELMMAGAAVVGIGTAVKDRGITIFQQVADEIATFMERKKYKSVDELVGIAHSA